MIEPRAGVFAYHDVGYECLDALLSRGVRVGAVFTHEDSPGENVWFKSVARLAGAHGLPVFAPASVNAPEWLARLRVLAPDILFSFYYRNMLCEDILRLPRLGAFNMHGSLLPKYRGRVPINWAIVHGETETGATLHHMVKRADAGDIVDHEAVPIGPEDTAREVFARVTRAARVVLERQLEALLKGRAPRRAQDETRASYFGARTPEDGRIDWKLPARSAFNLIRAVTHPYPGAFTQRGDRRLFIWRARVTPDSGAPGVVLSARPFKITAASGALEILRWQWQGAPEAGAGDDPGVRAGECFDHNKA